ncbi:DUF6869 domain-containing protein [Singulisphaera acidiphila]|uniref:DUF6869 domain-containing protein n=1 Tax=Singulisphaera acidiphila TaxID=466153 RepID=UPI0036F41240
MARQGRQNGKSQTELQWRFILAAVSLAKTDAELEHIAAGPLEHLLGRHVADYMAVVEKATAADPKFIRMLTTVWKHTITDEVWERFQTLKKKYSDSDDIPADT